MQNRLRVGNGIIRMMPFTRSSKGFEAQQKLAWPKKSDAARLRSQNNLAWPNKSDAARLRRQNKLAWPKKSDAARLRKQNKLAWLKKSACTTASTALLQMINNLCRYLASRHFQHHPR